MNTSILLLLATLSSAPAAGPALTSAPRTTLVAEFDHTHAGWKAVLDGRVEAGRFAYVSLIKDASALDAYLAQLAAVEHGDFTKWTKNQQLAFWINAYNAFTVKRVLQSYPFEKVNELGADKKGPWDERFIPLGKLAPDLKQEKLTLNDIENQIVRPTFKDARVHAALNCAAESCPPLRPEPYTGKKVGEELDAQVSKWLQNTALNRFDAEKKELQLSSIFQWYAKDFVDEAGSVPAWIAKHGPKHLVDWLQGAKDVKITFLDYSWNLNAKNSD
jgi:Protein of unknown function, DUF547